uniref:Uncharacterized protein n=1 Tax=Ficedula albicollis TaxID=59894 RepID=A0A803VS86_FICAL
MLYVLQQQVKEIQDDLEKLSPHAIKHTKKSRAVSRLAAAHRGAVRTLQAFANQFTDQGDEQIPAHYKDLGSLIRQLSLCSAKLEGDSSISEIIIDILLQVEDLNSLLENKQTPKPVKKHISASQAKSLRNAETSPARKHLLSPKGENKPLTLKGQRGQESKKPPCVRSLLTAVQQANNCAHILHNKYQEESGPPTSERNATLQGSTNVLVRPRAVKKQSVLESDALKKKAVLLPAKSQAILKSLKSRRAHPAGKQARFQEPTLAFQLKENKRPVQESRMPRVPSKPAAGCASPRRYVCSALAPAVPASPGNASAPVPVCAVPWHQLCLLPLEMPLPLCQCVQCPGTSCACFPWKCLCPCASVCSALAPAVPASPGNASAPVPVCAVPWHQLCLLPLEMPLPLCQCVQCPGTSCACFPWKCLCPCASVCSALAPAVPASPGNASAPVPVCAVPWHQLCLLPLEMPLPLCQCVQCPGTSCACFPWKCLCPCASVCSALAPAVPASPGNASAPVPVCAVPWHQLCLLPLEMPLPLCQCVQCPGTSCACFPWKCLCPCASVCSALAPAVPASPGNASAPVPVCAVPWHQLCLLPLEMPLPLCQCVQCPGTSCACFPWKCLCPCASVCSALAPAVPASPGNASAPVPVCAVPWHQLCLLPLEMPLPLS